MAPIKDIYELLENDKKEIMVLIYTNSIPPEDPKFILNEPSRCLEIYRNKKEVIVLNGLQKETIEKIKKLDIIYVCELDASTTDTENRIIYAYTANLTSKEELLKRTSKTAQTINQKTQSLKNKIQAKNKNQNS